ncbi:MAG: efflux RND transporter periplasmic adaptor subunit [Bacillota bacterium]|jgi:RND family efflux transporter MFP subunit
MTRAPLLCLLLLAACGRGDADETEGAGVPAVVGARTAVAAAGAFEETVNATGEVTARPGHVAGLGAPAQTRVARVLVTLGQRVTRGQPLVAFDQTTFAAEAQTAQAALTSAQHAYERARRLSEAGIVPRKEAEQAAAELASARGAAAVARHAEALATLRSPIGGVVTRMDAVLGAPVDAGAPLVEVADPSALDVLFTLSPAEAARIHAGAAVALEEGQTAGGASLGGGVVADIGAAVDSVSHAVPVRVRVTAPARTLRIGETVLGRITAGTRPDAVTVPVAALVPDSEGFQVFVVDARGIAHARPVTVGGRTAKVAEIRQGLAAGETVVTEGAYGVQDSARIQPPAAAAR